MTKSAVEKSAVGSSGEPVELPTPQDTLAPEEVDLFSIIESVFELQTYGAETEVALKAFEQSKILECMKALGYEYSRVVSNADPGSIEFRNARALFPPLPSRERVQAEGYRAFRIEDEQVIGHDAEAAIAMNLSRSAGNPAYEAALVGVETNGGCAGSAVNVAAQAFGLHAREKWRAVALSFSEAIDPYPAIQSPELVSAITAWSTCMQGQGFERFQNPYQAESAGMSASSPEAPSATEVQIALSDRDCRKETSLRSVSLRAVADRVRVWIAANESAIVELRAVIESERALIKEASK